MHAISTFSQQTSRVTASFLVFPLYSSSNETPNLWTMGFDLLALRLPPPPPAKPDSQNKYVHYKNIKTTFKGSYTEKKTINVPPPPKNMLNMSIGELKSPCPRPPSLIACSPPSS